MEEEEDKLTPANVFSIPGPPTQMHTPGRPVRYPYALAASTAACSLRKEMKLMPRFIHSWAMSMTGRPGRPKRTCTPRDWRVLAMWAAPKVGSGMVVVVCRRGVYR